VTEKREPEPRFLSPAEEAPDSRPSPRRRVVFMIVATFVTVGGVLTAFLVGTLGYNVRRSSMHEARLRGILVQTPTVYQVTEGLKEKAPLAAIVASERELQEAIDRWGGERKASILEKSKRWEQLRIFDAGDMMYFIFFDSKNIMRDYVFVSS
jgi:hypothetical protein